MTLHRRTRKRRPVLDPKLEAVMAALLEQTGQLFKTQAVKLPYLVDVVASHVLGRRLTQGHYEAWQHGVVATEVYDLVTNARFGGEALEGTPFQVTEPRGFEDRQVLELAAGGPDILDEDEREVIDFVAVQYGDLAPGRLGHLTKRMNPHIRRWPAAGKQVHFDQTAYEALPVGWDEVDVEIARARRHRIDEDPAYLVTDDELEDELAEIVG